MSIQYNIYVLNLSNDKYYIGKTKKSVSERFKQHLAGKVAWTTKYKPIGIIESIKSSDPFEEDRLTKKYMMEYSIENVRGGAYTMIELEDWQIKALKHEFTSVQDRCFKCNRSGHFARDCNYLLETYLSNFSTAEQIDVEVESLEKVKFENLKLKHEINKLKLLLDSNTKYNIQGHIIKFDIELLKLITKFEHKYPNYNELYVNFSRGQSRINNINHAELNNNIFQLCRTIHVLRISDTLTCHDKQNDTMSIKLLKILNYNKIIQKRLDDLIKLYLDDESYEIMQNKKICELLKKKLEL
jgi:hypothetical protein